MIFLQTKTYRKLLITAYLRPGNRGDPLPQTRHTITKGDYFPKVGGTELLPTAGPVAPVLTPSSIAWYEMMLFSVSYGIPDIGNRCPFTASIGVCSTPTSCASLMDALTCSLVAGVAAHASIAAGSNPALVTAFFAVSSLVPDV